MHLIAIAVVFLTPLIIAPGFSFYFDVVPKAAILLIGTALLLLANGCAPSAVRAFAASRYGRYYTLAAAASVAAVLLATTLSEHRGMAWNGSNWRRFGALEQCAAMAAALVISAFCAQSKALLKKVLMAICASGVLAAIYGIAQYFGWDPLLPREAYRAGEGPFRIVRPPGPLGHSDYFGAFLLWSLFIGLGLLVAKPRRVERAIGFAASLLTGSALVLTGSRGALAGLFAGLICFAVLTRPRIRTVGISAAAAALCLGLFLISPAGHGLRARIHWISEDRVGGARLLLWRDSARMSLDRPWTGFGPDTFVAQFPKYQSVELARAYPDFYHESPHNTILDEFTRAGPLAVLSLIGLFAAGVAGGRRAPALLSAACAVFIAQQFTVFTLPTAFYFYLGLGLLAGMDAAVADRISVPQPHRILMGGVSFAAAVLFAVSGVRLLAVDHSLAIAKHSLDTGDAASSIRGYQSALSRRDTGVTADLYFSRRWAMAGAPLAQFARDAALRSTETGEQRQNAWYNMAFLAAANNDYSGAETSLRSAIRCAPNWFKPHWSLSRLLFAAGRIREAQAEAALALKLDAGKDDEVVKTANIILRSSASANQSN